MLPKSHFLFGFVASIVLYFVFPEIGILNLAVFFFSSFLIDVDHYLYYVYRKKDCNLRRAFVLKKVNLKIRGKYYTAFYFFHGFEILVLLVVLGCFVWDVFYFICLGFLFHLCLDYVHQLRWRGRFDKISIVYDYFKYKNLKSVDELGARARLKK
jgi:hypothetical protein